MHPTANSAAFIRKMDACLVVCAAGDAGRSMFDADVNDDRSHSSLRTTFNPRLDARCAECQGRAGDVWRLSML